MKHRLSLLLLIPVVAALIATLLFVSQRGFGGGHGNFDMAISVLGQPSILLVEHLPLHGPDILMIVLLPALLNLIAWSLVFLALRAMPSAIAALCGWVLGTLVALVWDLVLIVVYHEHPPMSLVAMDIQGAASGLLLFVVPVWLFVLLPSYFFASPSSWMWSWPLCASLGAGVGLSILFLIRIQEETDPKMYAWYVLVAITCAGACVFSCVFHARHRNRPRQHLIN